MLEQLRTFWPAELHGRLFLVGGAVRDHLLNAPRNDADMVALVSTEVLVKLGFVRVDGVSTEPVWARTVAGVGRMEVRPLDPALPLEKELARRDFTVNAIAMRLDGTVIDPLGGAAALAQKRLTACTTHGFTDDPVRLFRAFRFECAGYAMDEGTQRLVTGREWEGALLRIPVERFSREMEKAFRLEKPRFFFDAMAKHNVGRGYFPELFRMAAVPAGPIEYHPEGDLLTHSLEVLERASALSPDPLARFGAFMHDIGKLLTEPAEYPKHHNHDKAGAPLAKKICARLRLPGDWGKTAAAASHLHQTAGLWPALRDTTKLRLAEKAARKGMERRLPVIVRADRGSFDEAQWAHAVNAATMTVQELGINPHIFEECKDDDWCKTACPMHKRGRKCPMPEAERPAFLIQRRVEKYRQLVVGAPRF